MILYVLVAETTVIVFFLHFMCNMAKIHVRVLTFQFETI